MRRTAAASRRYAFLTRTLTSDSGSLPIARQQPNATRTEPTAILLETGNVGDKTVRLAKSLAIETNISAARANSLASLLRRSDCAQRNRVRFGLPDERDCQRDKKADTSHLPTPWSIGANSRAKRAASAFCSLCVERLTSILWRLRANPICRIPQLGDNLEIDDSHPVLFRPGPRGAERAGQIGEEDGPEARPSILRQRALRGELSVTDFDQNPISV